MSAYSNRSRSEVASVCSSTARTPAYGSNAPIWMYSNGPSFAHVLKMEGTEEQQKWAQLFIDKQWGSTMVLTEPDAGSNTHRLATNARRDGDH